MSQIQEIQRTPRQILLALSEASNVNPASIYRLVKELRKIE